MEGLDARGFHCDGAFQQMLKMPERVKEGDLTDEAGRLLNETLRTVPFLENRRSRRRVKLGRSEIDLLITIRVGASERRLLCEVKASGQPRVARQACLQLRSLVPSNGRDYPVFIAPYVSQDAAAVCGEYNVGYLDFAGNCRLAFDRVYIFREGHPNPSVRKRELRFLYSPKAERILSGGHGVDFPGLLRRAGRCRKVRAA